MRRQALGIEVQSLLQPLISSDKGALRVRIRFWGTNAGKKPGQSRLKLCRRIMLAVGRIEKCLGVQLRCARVNATNRIGTW